MEKVFYKSKEVWVAIVWIILVAMKALGVEGAGEVVPMATDIYIASTPLIMLFLRLFFTKDKLTLK